MKTILLLAVISCAGSCSLAAETSATAPAPASVPAAAPKPSSPADVAWAEIRALWVKEVDADPRTDRDNYTIQKDRLRAETRAKGLQFWRAYPQDPRRYMWFRNAVSQGWASNYKGFGVGIPEAEAQAWRELLPVLRAEFMASPQRSPDEWVLLRSGEIRWDCLIVSGIARLDANLDPVRSAKLTAKEVVDEIIEFANQYPVVDQCVFPKVKNGRMVVDAMNMLLSENARGDTPESRELLDYALKRMITTKFEPLRSYANDLLTTKASGKVLDIKGRTVTGEDFDLASYRGRVVMLECWATWCADCIREMPDLKVFAAKLPAKDFALVGVPLDPAANREKVLGVLAKAGSNWPHIAEGQPIASRLGCRAVPYTVIVGRDGKVVATGYFHLGELETIIRRLIDGDAASAATSPAD